jgi:hypothetical protein
MIRKTMVLAALLPLSVPTLLSAQDIAVAGRAGTIGLGVEGAYGLGDRFTLRGGLGLTPIEIDGSSLIDVADEVEATLTLPKSWYNIGADLHIAGGFRIGGGMLFKSGDPTLEGTLDATGTIEIDGVEYTGSDVASVTGILDSKNQAPYAIVGFGSPRGSGIGLFLDVGVAFVGDPQVALSATGNSAIVESQEFQTRLRAEEQRIEDRAGEYLKLWPILNLGVRIGF